MSLKEKFLCVIASIFLFGLPIEGLEVFACHPEYVYPADGVEVPCPLVTLQGRIIRHTFPGVPNYENVEHGDAPETRWVLVIPRSEIQCLKQAGFIPKEDIVDEDDCGWIQLIAPHSENDPIPFSDKEVTVYGYLGTLAFHVHTPLAIEAIGIYGN